MQISTKCLHFTNSLISKDSQSFSMPSGVSGLAAVAGITLPQSKEQNLVDLSLEV